MKFWFEENMYGHYREINPKGRTGRFDFHCRAEACIWDFLRTRTTRISGTVTMEGFVEKAELEGTLKIDPVFGRELVYDFVFHDGKGRMRFLGKKSVRFLEPVSSMTTLIGRLERDGLPFADVDSRFNILELPAFLLSWRIGF